MKVTGSGLNSTDTTRDVTGAGSAGSIGAAKNKRKSGNTDHIQSDISEKVAISGRAKDAAKATTIAKSTPDVDEAKIAKLKAAIQDGSYSVDAAKVADRLVDEHLFNMR